MNSFRTPGLFVCILYAVIGDVSVLSLLSVLRITNLRVFNTYAGSTPAASTTMCPFSINRLHKPKPTFKSLAVKRRTIHHHQLGHHSVLTDIPKLEEI
jgi:hypothetical protein